MANAIHKSKSYKIHQRIFKTIQKKSNTANIMAKAFQRINNASPYEDISFTGTISENKSIPYTH